MSDKATADNKRPRDEEPEALPESESKRIRTDLFLSILDDESEPDNSDLDYVIRSLEEEIVAVPRADSGEIEISVSDSDPKQQDLGFLLEASDDELGLPPAETADGNVTSCGADVFSVGDDVEAPGFGKIWGLVDDELFLLDFGFGSDKREDFNGGEELAVTFDGGLFDYDEGMGGAVDFNDLTWRSESLPAV